MKIAVYTALFGAYDYFLEPTGYNSDYDYYLFTDQDIESNVWRVVKLPFKEKIFREIKTLPQKYLPDYEATVWVDANIRALRDISQYVDTVLKYGDIGFPKHPSNDCVTQELQLCIHLGKDDRDKMASQVHEYINEGFPIHYGQVETGVIVRKNTAKVQRFNELWWDEVREKSVRDQLSVMYAVWKSGVEIVQTEPASIRGKFFQIYTHKK